MKRSAKKTSSGGKIFGILFALLAVIVIVVGFLFFNPFGGKASNTAKKTNGSSTSASSQTVKYEPSQEEKDYLKKRLLMSTHLVRNWMNLLCKQQIMKPT